VCVCVMGRFRVSVCVMGLGLRLKYEIIYSLYSTKTITSMSPF